MSNNAYEKEIIRVGIITVSLGIIANFVPAIYLWIFEGLSLDIGSIMKIWGLAFVTYGISWIVQPISFYPAMGTAGTYISWLAGSGSDIRLPAANSAKKAAEVEDSTPEGDVIASIGVACSVFVSVSIITIFTILGAGVINALPPVIVSAFTYILPALFGCVYMDLATKNLKMGVIVFVLCILLLNAIKLISIPSGFSVLICVVCGLLVAHLIFKQEEASSKKGQ